MNATTYSAQPAPQPSAPRTLFPVTMAATLAALAALAYQLIDAWLGNQWLLSWLAMSGVVLAGLWWLGGFVNRLSLHLQTRLSPWIEQRRAAQADARFLALAQQDPRLMADITAALARQQTQESVTAIEPTTAAAPSYHPAQARNANIDEEIASGRPGYLKLFRV